MINYTDNETSNLLILVPIVISIIVFALIIVSFVGLNRMFKKIGEKSYKAYVPFLNLYVLVKYFQMSTLDKILTFIPLINAYTWYKVADNIVKCYNKDNIYTLNMFLMPFVFLFLVDNNEIQDNQETKTRNYLEDQSVLSQKAEKQEKVDTFDINPDDLIYQKKDYSTVPKYKATRRKEETKPEEKKQEEVVTSDGPKICPECGASVSADATNCFLCGTKLK